METNNFLEEILTPEEKQILIDLEKKISEKIKSIQNHKYDHLDNDTPLDLSQKHPETISPTHITEAPHEIKITVVAEISSIDDKGYLQDVKDVFRKNYHIPVLTGKDYMVYTEKFFSTFEQKLTATCQELVKPVQ
jgi:hypothetical protein